MFRENFREGGCSTLSWPAKSLHCEILWGPAVDRYRTLWHVIKRHFALFSFLSSR